MKSVKKPVKFKSLSLPEPLFNEIKNYVQKSKNYRNMAEFLRESIREKLDYEIPKKRMTGITISDKEIVERETERGISAYKQRNDPISKKEIIDVLSANQRIINKLIEQESQEILKSNKKNKNSNNNVRLE